MWVNAPKAEDLFIARVATLLVLYHGLSGLLNSDIVDHRLLHHLLDHLRHWRCLDYSLNNDSLDTDMIVVDSLAGVMNDVMVMGLNCRASRRVGHCSNSNSSGSKHNIVQHLVSPC